MRRVVTGTKGILKEIKTQPGPDNGNHRPSQLFSLAMRWNECVSTWSLFVSLYSFKSLQLL
jgi:hypothetical protein